MAIIEISAAGGNFNATSSWVGGVVPTSADDIIGTASSGPLTINVNGVCKSIDLTYYNNTITQQASEFLINGNTNYAGVAWNVAPNIILNGTWSRSLNNTYNKRLMCFNMGIQVLSANVKSAYEVNFGNLKLYSNLVAQPHNTRIGINGTVNYYPGTYSITIPDLDDYEKQMTQGFFPGTSTPQPFLPQTFIGVNWTNQEADINRRGTVFINCNHTSAIFGTENRGVDWHIINGTVSVRPNQTGFWLRPRGINGATVSFIQSGGHLNEFMMRVYDDNGNTNSFVIDTISPIRELQLHCPQITVDTTTTSPVPFKNLILGATTSFGYVKNISSCVQGRSTSRLRTFRPFRFRGGLSASVLEWHPGPIGNNLSLQSYEFGGNNFDIGNYWHQVPDLMFDSDYTNTIGTLFIHGQSGMTASKTIAVGNQFQFFSDPNAGPTNETIKPKMRSGTASIQATVNIGNLGLINRMDVRDINFGGQTVYGLSEVSLVNTTGATTSISGGGGSPITTAYSFIQ